MNRVKVNLFELKISLNKNGYNYQLHVLTMVDPVTGWFECCQWYGTPTVYRVQQILDTVGMAQYPQPKEIGMNNGSEFKKEFFKLCDNMGMKPKQGNSWNP